MQTLVLNTSNGSNQPKADTAPLLHGAKADIHKEAFAWLLSGQN